MAIRGRGFANLYPLTAFLVRVEVFLEICFSAFLFRVLKSIEENPATVLFALSVFYTGFGFLVFVFFFFKVVKTVRLNALKYKWRLNMFTFQL